MIERQPYRTIARIRSDFPSKFGVPRQSGLVPELRASVVFEPDFRDPEFVKGIEGFSHLWLIWEFSLQTGRARPTIRPQRLRGRRLGVFATRAPLRPNPIGLSSVQLDEVVLSGAQGPELHVSGADLVDGTPILDIKPYVPMDCHPGARWGFVAENPERLFDVDFPPELLDRIPPERREALLGVLATDPVPMHMRHPGRTYGLPFAGMDVRFLLEDRSLRVLEINPLSSSGERWPGYEW